MIVMVCGSVRGEVHYLMGKYPNRLGVMYSPVASGVYVAPKWYMQYALDNGAFIKFDESKYFKMLENAKKISYIPLFTVIPDVVGDHNKTLHNWYKYYPIIKKYGFKMAFACQEGCSIDAIPEESDCIFIGGKSARWKLEFAYKLSKSNMKKWIHMGRVTTLKRLKYAEKLGINSVDGNWFFGGPNSKQYRDFMEHFEGPFFDKLGPKEPGFFPWEHLKEHCKIKDEK